MTRGARRVREIVIAALVVCGAVVVAAPSAGALTNGSGHVSCTLTGLVNFKPALTNAGTRVGKATIPAKQVSVKACGGTGDGSHVTGGRFQAHGKLPTTSCVTLFSGTARSVSLKGQVKWATSGGVALSKSVVSLTALQVVSTSPMKIVLSGRVSGGSFINNPISVAMIADSSQATFNLKCAASGLNGFYFSGVSGTSILSN